MRLGSVISPKELQLPLISYLVLLYSVLSIKKKKMKLELFFFT